MSTGKGKKADEHRRSELVSALGGIAEWYDYMLFAFMTPVFTRVFFPETDRAVGVILTFGVFAGGYIVRPLGALFWGRLGDKRGRKVTLVASTVAMVVPMGLVALLPSYATWGFLAPVLLLLLRMGQGFAVGGETAGVIVLLLESAPPGERGRVGSYSQTVIGGGILLASLLSALLTGTLTAEALDAWGWRALYGLGAAMALAVAWLMQRYVEEPEDFKLALSSRRGDVAPISRAFSDYRGRLVRGTVLAGFAGVSYYVVLAYFTVYMETVLDVDHTVALLATSAALAVWTFSAPAFGKLSDRVGRRPVVLWSSAALAVVTVPLFYLADLRATWALFLAQVLLVVPVAAYNTINAVQLGEMFPVSERYSGVAITYNFGQSFLGGTAPFFASLLAEELHLQLAPAFYLVLWCVIAFVVTLFVKETANQTIEQLDVAHVRRPRR